MDLMRDTHEGEEFPTIELLVSPERENGNRYVSSHSFELGELHPACDDYEVVRYEPAVPKCATCNRFNQIRHNETGGWCTEFDGIVPSDGSGYCWRHPEAKRQP